MSTGLGLKVDFINFSKLDNLFYLHQSKLEKILASDLYIDFRREIDNVISKIKSGTLNEDEGKEYEDLLSYSISFLEEQRMNVPYVEIFKYALLFQFNIIKSDVNFESIDNVLKLKELSKMIILPERMLKGGTDNIVPYRERKRRTRTNVVLICLILLFGMSYYIVFESTYDKINTMIVDNIIEFRDSSREIWGEATYKVLPHGAYGYYKTYPKPYKGWVEAKEEVEAELLALPPPKQLALPSSANIKDTPDDIKGTPLAILAVEKMVVPENVLYTAEEIATFEEAREIIEGKYNKDVKLLNEAIKKINETGVGIDYLSLFKGKIPIGLTDKVTKLYKSLITGFGDVFQGIATDLQNKVVTAKQISQHRKRGVLMNEANEQKPVGMFGKIINTISMLGNNAANWDYSQSGPLETLDTNIKETLLITRDEMRIKMDEINVASDRYLTDMNRLITSQSEGLKKDFYNVLWHANLSALLLYLSLNLTFILFFGTRNRVSPFFMATISYLLSKSTIIGGLYSISGWVIGKLVNTIEDNEYKQQEDNEDNEYKQEENLRLRPLHENEYKQQEDDHNVEELEGGNNKKTRKHKKQKGRKHKKQKGSKHKKTTKQHKSNKGRKHKKTTKQRKSNKGRKHKTGKHKKSRK